MSIRDDQFDMMNRLLEQMQASMLANSPFTMWDEQSTGRALQSDEKHSEGQSRRNTGGFPFEGQLSTGTESQRPTGMQSRMSTMRTNVDIEQTDDGYVVMVDIPGFEREDISVRFHDGALTIEATVDENEETETVSRRQRRQVFEHLTIPETVVPDELSATYHNGVLEIVLPTEDDEDEYLIDIE